MLLPEVVLPPSILQDLGVEVEDSKGRMEVVGEHHLKERGEPEQEGEVEEDLQMVEEEPAVALEVLLVV